MLHYKPKWGIGTRCRGGRPNGGKSSMFNDLAGENRAMTDQLAGLTRDRNETKVRLLGGEVRVVDTPGWQRPSKRHKETSLSRHHPSNRGKITDTSAENSHLFQ